MAEPEPKPESRVLKGTYRIERKLGSGAFGTVYTATQLGLGKLVAVKLLMPEAFKTPGTVERFEREALLASKISHPVMAQVLDFGVDEGTPFLVMELVDGREVAEVLASDGPFAPSRAVAIMRQLASLLAEVHGHGIVHRDLKPANLKLLRYSKDARQLHLKVLDFGIAKDTGADVQQSLTATGSFVGTPRYMSPEQVKGSGIGLRSDLYSCGVIFYELLTGDAPFRAASLAELIAHLLYDPPAPLPARFPPLLRDTVARLLEKDPAQRFADANALDAALERCEAVCRESGFDDAPLAAPLGFGATAAGSAGAHATGGDVGLARTGAAGDATGRAASGRTSTTGRSAASLTGRSAGIDPMGETSAVPAGALAASAIGVRPASRLPWLVAGAAVVLAAAAVALVIVHPWRDRPAVPAPASQLAQAAPRLPAAVAAAAPGQPEMPPDPTVVAPVPAPAAPRPGASMQPLPPGPPVQPTPPATTTSISVSATAGPGSFAPAPAPPSADTSQSDLLEACQARLDQADQALRQLRFKRALSLTKALLADKATHRGGACDAPRIRASAVELQCEALCQTQDIKGYQACLHNLSREAAGKNMNGSQLIARVQTVCNKFVQP